MIMCKPDFAEEEILIMEQPFEVIVFGLNAPAVVSG